MRKYLLICIILLLTLTDYVWAAKGHGFLLGGPRSAGASGPREGDIKLQDEHGHWYVVSGISVNPPPFTNRSTTVAVIDSGVIADHPQLKGLIAEQQDFMGEGPEDRIGHGTVVAILVRLPTASVPPELRHLPPPRFIIAKVANADGSIVKQQLISAIEWAAQQGARVVNLSLGFREGTDDYSDLCYVIARHPDVLFVAAAGNLGPTVKVYPAACDARNLMSVGTNDDWSGRSDIRAPGKVMLVPIKEPEATTR